MITEVVGLTDHVSGENPYMSATSIKSTTYKYTLVNNLLECTTF
jgi:hypothetical protein